MAHLLELQCCVAPLPWSTGFCVADENSISIRRVTNHGHKWTCVRGNSVPIVLKSSRRDWWFVVRERNDKAPFFVVHWKLIIASHARQTDDGWIGKAFPTVMGSLILAASIYPVHPWHSYGSKPKQIGLNWVGTVRVTGHGNTGARVYRWQRCNRNLGCIFQVSKTDVSFDFVVIYSWSWPLSRFTHLLFLSRTFASNCPLIYSRFQRQS